MTPESFQIQTPRLYLRRWTDADAADAFSLWGSAVVMRWVDTPDASEEVSLRSLRRGDEVFLTRGVCLWPVVLTQTDQLIGCCGFHVDELPETLEMGYHFLPQFWGHGYATEAASACLSYAFEQWGAKRIVAYVHPENHASRRLLERLHFVEDGLDEDECVYWLASTRPL